MFKPISTIIPARGTTSDRSELPTLTKASLMKTKSQVGSSCVESIGHDVAGTLEKIVTPTNALIRNALDYFTGIPSWASSIRTDTCDGRVGTDTAQSTSKMIGRTLGTTIAANGVFILGVSAVASGSIPFLIGGLVLGGAVLAVSPSLGEKVIGAAGELGMSFIKSFKERVIGKDS